MTAFILENLRLAGESGPQSLRIAQGRIVERGPGAGALEDDLPRRDCGGYLACAGFVDSHIHLDKALILDRCPICEGTLAEAVRLTATAKAAVPGRSFNWAGKVPASGSSRGAPSLGML